MCKCPLLHIVSSSFSVAAPRSRTWCSTRCSPSSLPIPQQNRKGGHHVGGSPIRVYSSIWKFSKTRFRPSSLDLPGFLLMMQLAILTLITIKLSYTRSIALKSSIVKVMGGMLGTWCREIMLTDWTCKRCFFRVKAVAPPLIMVLVIHLGWLRGLSSFSREQLWLFCLSNRLAHSWSFPRLYSTLFLPSDWYIRGLWMNSFKWASLMNSSILSFKAPHSSVEWPRLRLYQQRFE